ncbi:MAG: DUF465 domain-containing protein [Alphaproteobacteria bacterium]|nr:DUF465 domain-containing protein [Alphaproteobacteria bacterium]
MTVQSHIAELSERHRRLEIDLHDHLQRPQTDSLTLTEIKRKKLRLKEEIERLSRDEA